MSEEDIAMGASGSSSNFGHERWAHLRFSVVGQLLASPPARGRLRAEFKKLGARIWVHPITGEPVRFGVSTIERWFYRAVHERQDPLGVLRRKVRQDAGSQEAMGRALREALRAQYAAHPTWSIRLHHDNVCALAQQHPQLKPVPSYSTLRRFFLAQGLRKRRRPSARETDGARAAEARLAEREVRSYEAEFVGGLWHWDGHWCSRKVLTTRGQWVVPVLIGVIDDQSRLACHLQWYLAEDARNVAHALSQAFQKRGLPRAAMSDRGQAMLAAEVAQALLRLGIVQETTLPYSPYQNGKIEHLWTHVEARLMAMLEGVVDLTLATLNDATQAWVEFDYNRHIHSETGQAPLTRYLAGPQVLRDSPDSSALRLAFTRADRRTQRRSDGTLVIETRRFEVPNRYRHLNQVDVRYASWDLSQVHLIDELTGQVLCRLYPQDKTRNANALRRPLDPIATRAREGDGGSAHAGEPAPAAGMAPLLQSLMAQQAATGVPPAYLPQDDRGQDEASQDERPPNQASPSTGEDR